MERCALAVALACVLVMRPAAGGERSANPADYRALVARLTPGDTLRLVAGDYRDGLPLHGIHGDASRPIRIEGPRDGPRAVFHARPGANTISLADASHLRLSDLTLDGRNLPVDGVKAERGDGRPVHDTTLERLTIVRHGIAQDVVAISTKVPAWNWQVRGCLIVGAGTGMYFGNSDGSAPFVAGVIEGNMVIDTIGYNVEVKHQRERPPSLGIPAGPHETVVRANVFAKARHASTGDLARPNVLVGHFPPRGEGSADRYFVAENLFFDNPGEALLKAEGRLVVERNLFVNHRGDAIVIQPHHDRPRYLRLRDNVIAAEGTGVIIRDLMPQQESALTANRILAMTPVVRADNAGGTSSAY
ncbi:MAG: hypothetical protein ABIP49_11120, partial [Lysobacterales bacterium]